MEKGNQRVKTIEELNSFVKNQARIVYESLAFNPQEENYLYGASWALKVIDDFINTEQAKGLPSFVDALRIQGVKLK